MDENFKELKISHLSLEKLQLEKEQSLRIKLLKLEVALRRQLVQCNKAQTTYYLAAAKAVQENRLHYPSMHYPYPGTAYTPDNTAPNEV